MLLVHDEVVFCGEQGTDELVGRGEVVEAAQRSGILHTGIVGVKGNKIGNAHGIQLVQCKRTV